jgi:hypothetical protein
MFGRGATADGPPIWKTLDDILFYYITTTMIQSNQNRTRRARAAPPFPPIIPPNFAAVALGSLHMVSFPLVIMEAMLPQAPWHLMVASILGSEHIQVIMAAGSPRKQSVYCGSTEIQWAEHTHLVHARDIGWHCATLNGSHVDAKAVRSALRDTACC